MGLKERLRAGAVRGIVQVLPSPAVTEVIAASGVGFAMIDGEHAGFDVNELAQYARVSDARGLPVLYRAESSSAALGKALDTGVSGIVVPRIESAEEARRVVEATRFAPIGSRGVGAGRASGYGAEMQRLCDEANERTLVAVMIETAAGLEALEAILAVNGIDLVFVGPTDLAASLGVPADGETLEAAIDRIVGATVRAGLFAGAHCGSERQAQRLEALGARFISLGLDSTLLIQAVRATLPDTPDPAGDAAARTQNEGNSNASSH